MRRLMKLVVLGLVFAAVMPGFSLRAFGATEEMGFVEYQTEASINFEEVVEVILVNEDTGHYYTHRLYRINEYTGNFSVPFGTYSVSAKVITEHDETLSQYAVACLAEKVEVVEQNIAVSVNLRIDEFSPGDVSGDIEGEVGSDDSVIDDWTIPEASENTGEPEVETEDKPDAEIDESLGESADNVQADSGVDAAHKDDSLLGSLVVSLLILGIGAAVLWFFYRSKEG